MTAKVDTKRVEAARATDEHYSTLEADFHAWYARLPLEEDPPSVTLAAYMRAAYGAGYMQALREAA